MFFFGACGVAEIKEDEPGESTSRSAEGGFDDFSLFPQAIDDLFSSIEFGLEKRIHLLFAISNFRGDGRDERNENIEQSEDISFDGQCRVCDGTTKLDGEVRVFFDAWR